MASANRVQINEKFFVVQQDYYSFRTGGIRWSCYLFVDIACMNYAVMAEDGLSSSGCDEFVNKARERVAGLPLDDDAIVMWIRMEGLVK